MHCKQCGAEINDGAKFCGVCGTPTVAAAASTAGDAIYVEARPIESQSVEAQFQAAEDAEAAACLQDSLRESIGSLTRASVISLLYVLFFNYVLGGGSLGLDYMILLGQLLAVAEDAQVKAELKGLKDDISFSSNMSHPHVQEIERQFSAALEAVSNSMSADEPADVTVGLVHDARNIWKKRNAALTAVK